jgi:outer membrane protein OmpA-like peptidoglycan-associated protein
MKHPYVTVPILLGILGFQTTQIQAQSETGTSQKASIAGIVYDADSKQPIPGATVLVQDPSGKTVVEQRVGTDGQFRLDVAKDQTYTLNTKSFGYDSETKKLSFTSGLPTNLSNYGLAMHKAGKAAAPAVAPPALTTQTASTSPTPPISTQPASSGNSTPEPTVTTPAPTPATAVATTPSAATPKPAAAPIVTPPATSEQSAAVVTASAPATVKNRRGTAATRRQAAVAQATAPAATPSAPGSSVAPPKTLDAKVSNTTPLLIAPKGEPTQLKSIRFAQSKPELLPESQSELDQLLSFMNGNPKAEIELAGHTDNQGNFEENVQLSRLRVEAVKEYLVRNGVATNRIVAKGYGPSRPIASNNHEETRRLNRRVEFTVTKE